MAMRSGLGTIQQTLTAEAASVLSHSIADAGRRGHSQTTPLHVAATLLSSPNGFLRQACIRSHPNSSHPLQCRALELCFSVALDRLPSSGSAVSHVAEPPISNALMAALKRAQANQRRGCPEQQQQPLLAVKVELEQLVISILDDPSVSRVMREASFSSPAVKATIEQIIANSPSHNPKSALASIGGVAGFSLVSQRPAPAGNLYLNPRLQICASPAGDRRVGGQRMEDVKKVVDVLQRTKKRNPVLVGDHEPEAVMKELLQKIERKELGEILRDVLVVSVEKELSTMCTGRSEEKERIRLKIKELGVLIESKMNGQGGVIFNLGDLRWLVEQQGGVSFGASVSGPVQEVVSEIAKLLCSHREGGKLWLMGTATCETYLRCQVYHPSMENEWDLQALPIAARSPVPGLFPRIGGNGILSSGILSGPMESLSTLKGFQVNPLSLRRFDENGNSSLARRMTCCPSCVENYEKDLAKLVANEFEKSSSDAKSDEQHQHQLPKWLQLAKPANVKPGDHPLPKENEDQLRKQKSDELQKKWNETCSRLHPGYRPIVGTEKPSPLTSSSLLDSHSSTNGNGNAGISGSIYNSSMWREQFQPKLQVSRGTILPLGATKTAINLPLETGRSPPSSPVRTDLVLGGPKLSTTENVEPAGAYKDRSNNLTGHVSAQRVSDRCNLKIACTLDEDSFKRLFKGLTQKVSWQTEAATSVATAVTKCRSGGGKPRGVGMKGDTWLLFLGPDRVGKKKMAAGLSELVFGTRPICIRLGLSDAGNHHEDDGDECCPRTRRRTVLNRIADAVRRSPFSVLVLEDVDQADSLIHGSLIRAMERGRLSDSHGREVGLGSVIFILTAEWLPESLNSTTPESGKFNEDRLAAAAASYRPLLLSIGSSSSLTVARNKRRPAWLEKEEGRAPTLQKPTLAIDLNLSADDSDAIDISHGSRNSSDLTFEAGFRSPHCAAMKELVGRVDETITFKQVDFETMSKSIASSLKTRFAGQVGKGTLEVEEEALEQLLAAIWFGPGSGGIDEVESWADRVLVPVFREMKDGCAVKEDGMIRLLVAGAEAEASRPSSGNWLPSQIAVTRG
ncbi:protein SUPPRESSOR OF MAX2 1-like [Nymphaea colorata]|nr:protein SUPPRESSOR OF MAX2 1-like [Nymphaea colorata]